MSYEDSARVPVYGSNELDAAIAKLIGFEGCDNCGTKDERCGCEGVGIGEGMPHYSTRIEDAWLVIYSIQNRGLFHLRKSFWEALADQARTADGLRVHWPDALGFLGARFPEAVCLAALSS